jgi:3-hydroxyacyl-CoA dehydrogenase
MTDALAIMAAGTMGSAIARRMARTAGCRKCANDAYE